MASAINISVSAPVQKPAPRPVSTSTRTRPFQIPLGALIPVRVENLIAANKNIGTTHITNGCYRLHPVEWNIGEAAGLLASFALEQGKSPKAIHEDKSRLRALQREVVADGVPLCWLIDVPVSSPDFAAIQHLVMAGGYAGNDGSLEFEPDKPVTAQAQAAWLQCAAGPGRPAPCGGATVSRAAFARAMFEVEP